MEDELGATSTPAEAVTDAGGGAEASTPQSEPDPFEAAVAEARSEIAGQESQEPTPADGEKPAEGEAKSDATEGQSTPPSDEGQPSAPPPEKPATPQSVLDRIRTLVDQGREKELSPVEQGILRKLEAKAIERRDAETTAEKQARDAFLALDALRVEDPGELARVFAEEPRRAEFYKLYKAAHPDISVDNPEGNGQTDPTKVKQETVQTFFDQFDRAVEASWEKTGLPAEKLAELYEKASTPWEYLDQTVEAMAEARAKDMLAKALPDERRAIELEVQARYTPKTIVTPRPANGMPNGTTPSSAPANNAPFNDAFEDAARRAREQSAA